MSSNITLYSHPPIFRLILFILPCLQRIEIDIYLFADRAHKDTALLTERADIELGHTDKRSGFRYRYVCLSVELYAVGHTIVSIS
jgi:hypothetical protein